MEIKINLRKTWLRKMKWCVEINYQDYLFEDSEPWIEFFEKRKQASKFIKKVSKGNKETYELWKKINGFDKKYPTPKGWKKYLDEIKGLPELKGLSVMDEANLHDDDLYKEEKC